MMTELSPVDAAIQIRTHLGYIEKDQGVRIIYAAESGSRAWGCPSKDSDYDVRFIYARPKRDYLSIQKHRDTIEIPAFHDDMLGAPFDASGWDIRHALSLAVKSNAALWEWLNSPIPYMKDQQATKDILDFVGKNLNLNALKYHYHCLLRNAWEKIQVQPSAKLYCYALRSALAINWMVAYNEAPPMDFDHLLQVIKNCTILYEDVQSMIRLKLQSKEKDTEPRNELFDTYIDTILKKEMPKPNEIPIMGAVLGRADRLFRKIIK